MSAANIRDVCGKHSSSAAKIRHVRSEDSSRLQRRLVKQRFVTSAAKICHVCGQNSSHLRPTFITSAPNFRHSCGISLSINLLPTTASCLHPVSILVEHKSSAAEAAVFHHYITSRYITIPYVTLHFDTLRYITSPDIT